MKHLPEQQHREVSFSLLYLKESQSLKSLREADRGDLAKKIVHIYISSQGELVFF